jgi:hypothetical protein
LAAAAEPKKKRKPMHSNPFAPKEPKKIEFYRTLQKPTVVKGTGDRESGDNPIALGAEPLTQFQPEDCKPFSVQQPLSPLSSRVVLGLRPPKVMKNALYPVTALPFVIPSGYEKRPLYSNRSPLCHPEWLWACGPKVMKNALCPATALSFVIPSEAERLSELSRVRVGLVVEKTWTESTWETLCVSHFSPRLRLRYG